MISGSVEPAPLFISDTRTDPRFANHPAVAAFPRVGSYLGVPITLSDGTLFGTLCAVDPKPTTIESTRIDLLIVLARMLATYLERDREVEDRRRAEAALREVNAALEAESRAKSRFVSVASHELRTPLSAIQGFAEMLRDFDPTSAQVVEYCDEILKSSQRLTRMIGEMLDLTRYQVGQGSLARQPVDLAELAAEAAYSLKPAAPNHTFRVAADPDVPTVPADREAVNRVLINLLGNAVKYAPNGGDVEIAVARHGDEVWLSVRDQGPGIPAAALEAIFEPYARVNSATVKRTVGAGLGLALAREIARAHGGRIWAESTPGYGATFFVALPLFAPASAETEG